MYKFGAVGQRALQTLTGIIRTVLEQRAGLCPQQVPLSPPRILPPSPSSSASGWGMCSGSPGSLSASSSASLSFSYWFSPSPSPSARAKPESWMAVTLVPHADWKPARYSQPTVSSSPAEQPAPPGLMVFGPTAAQGSVAAARSPLEARRRRAAGLRTPSPLAAPQQPLRRHSSPRAPPPGSRRRRIARTACDAPPWPLLTEPLPVSSTSWRRPRQLSVP